MEERWGRECEICAETQREMRKLSCGHELCQTCLAAVPRPQCPFCRQPFPEGSEAERMLYVGAECSGCGERTGTRDACWCLPCRQLLCCRCAVFAHEQGHPKRPAASTAALAPARSALQAQELSSHAKAEDELRQLMADVAERLQGAEDTETATRKTLSVQLGEAGVREAAVGEELPGPSAAEEMGTRFLRLLGPGRPSPVPPSLAERIRQRGLTAEDIAAKLLRFIDSGGTTTSQDAQSQTDEPVLAQRAARPEHPCENARYPGMRQPDRFSGAGGGFGHPGFAGFGNPVLGGFGHSGLGGGGPGFGSSAAPVFGGEPPFLNPGPLWSFAHPRPLPPSAGRSGSGGISSFNGADPTTPGFVWQRPADISGMPPPLMGRNGIGGGSGGRALSLQTPNTTSASRPTTTTSARSRPAGPAPQSRNSASAAASRSSPDQADSPSSSSCTPLAATPSASGVSFSLERALSAVQLGESALPTASDEEEEEDEVLWVIGGGPDDRRTSVEVLRWDAPSSVHRNLLQAPEGPRARASWWRRRPVAVCVGQERWALVAEQWSWQSLVPSASGSGEPRLSEALVPQPPFSRTAAAGLTSTTEPFVKFRRCGGAERNVAPTGPTFFLVGGQKGPDPKTATATVGAGDGTSWRQLPDLTQPRLAPQCLVHRGYLYAMGGGRSDSVQTSVERLALFALETGARWQAAPALPAPARFTFAATVFRDRVYVTGGSTASVANPWSSCVDRLEGTSETLVWDGAEWSEGPPMQKARHGHSLVVWRRRLVALGGLSQDAQHTAEALKEDGSGWEMLDVQLKLPAMFSAVIAVKP